MYRNVAKGDSQENNKLSKIEKQRCEEMGVTVGDIITLEEMAKSDDLVFSATGITKGDLLDGITCEDGIAKTETLLVRGKSRTIRRIQSIHYLNRKDEEIRHLFI
jgi:fructose-1,6-bisphosphatase II